MMKFLLMMIFMIPLSLMNYFWLIQNLLMLLLIKFLIFNLLSLEFTNLSYYMSIDLISFWLIILTMLISSLMIMASENLLKNKFYTNMFIFIVIILLLILFITFSVMNLFTFYLFFESSLIPTMFLIMGWGYQPERIQASIYLLFYTLFMSLPMLISILFIYKYNNSLMFMFMNNFYYNNELFYLTMIFAFLVKLPMFMFHFWLPKAHVEAPIGGSMILAGILLKLGGYGLIRVMSMISMNLNFIWINLSMIGGFLVSMLCLRQIDIKSLIAYSSVVHMGIILGGLMTLFYWGVNGAYILMIAHGLSSSGLFCLANIIYERFSSRSLLINKGLINMMPSMTLWWFLISSSNMAAPPSLNLLGEIILLTSMICWSWMLTIILMLLSFFSASYSLYLYSYSQHGLMYSGIYSYFQGYTREYLLLMMHWIPLNFLIFKSDMILL
uniref:NADH-ubiquinone oxidoreductase chain 4 n=1 Tax=Pamphilius sp. ZJUH_2016023 TaxID=2491164 RepID=A0A3Q8UA76_9HYME|nr:NADH dehydrogenase subunit 4 [Pamphilius sp. ZJUH_2016023]